MLAVGGAVLSACATPVWADEPVWTGPERIGRLPPVVNEASGLAVSRRNPDVFCTHSDSGGAPVLHAIHPDGTLRGALRINGVWNVDWEDMASFTLDGRAWLLIADVGDNAALRKGCVLLVVPEPDPAELSPTAELAVDVAWTIPVRYPDGPRDCESVAVDVNNEKVYLLAKRITPHGLYELPLRPVAEGAVSPVARRVGEMPAFPPAPEPLRQRRIPTGMYRAQPTGMDFSEDGSMAAVLTYGDVILYSKNDDESWPQALARPGWVLSPHGLNQAEGIAFGAGGDELLVTSEGVGAPIIRYRTGR